MAGNEVSLGKRVQDTDYFDFFFFFQSMKAIKVI